MTTHYLQLFLDRPIAYHRPLLPIAGSLTATVMLSQALYWSKRTKDPDGWFYKTREEWTEETGMTRREQETARASLRESGFWEEKLQGQPAQLYFRVNFELLESKLSQLLENQGGQLVGTKAPNKEGGNVPTSRAESAQHSIGTEITSETTSEITPPPVAPKHTGLVQNVVLAALRTWCNERFQRAANSPWSYLEEQTLVDIAKRPNVLTELQTISEYALRGNGYFPKSVEALLLNWTKTLDQSRGKTTKTLSIMELKTVKETLENSIAKHPCNPRSERYDKSARNFDEMKGEYNALKSTLTDVIAQLIRHATPANTIRPTAPAQH